MRSSWFSQRCAHFLSQFSLLTRTINITHCYHSSSSFITGSTFQTLHGKLIKTGCLTNSPICNRLLYIYVKSQNLVLAHKLFDEMPSQDVRTWTILISGFARMGFATMVFKLFREMQIEGVCPNEFTFSCLLKCCASLNELNLGREIHGWRIKHGFGSDIVFDNSILDLYVKCGAVDCAANFFQAMVERDTVSCNIMIGAYLKIGNVDKSLNLFKTMTFKDVASWNTVIDGLIRNGCELIALKILYQMVEAGLVFNKVTFSTALVLVSSLKTLELGRQLHSCVLRFGFHSDGFIRSSLTDMYCKFGQMDKALVICGKIQEEGSVRMRTNHASGEDSTTETILWSSIVSGYIRNGKYEDAFKTLSSMIHQQVEVDKFTATSIISACANAGILELGRQIHAYIQKIGHKLDVHMSSSFIDMYAKCGGLADAWSIFEESNKMNVVLCTSMISACALHGQGREAVQLYELMINEGITPNEVTFVSVLTACSHAGLLDEGSKYFSLMKDVYGINPGVEHFTCMVDLYSRAGHLKETKEFIYKMGLSHIGAVWRPFLSSCRVHKDMEMGKLVCQELLKLEPFDAGPYILLSNIYSTNNRWEEAAKLRSLMQQRGITKHPGQSWIQLKNQVHTFVMGDRSHPQDAEIYAYLDRLIRRLKEIGYSSDAQPVMQDVEEEQGEVILGCHSEKLAIAYGIISTTSGTPIRIMKNLRICTDCHNFIKYTCQLLDREIIVRDTYRFHHFNHGNCSCGDYW